MTTGRDEPRWQTGLLVVAVHAALAFLISGTRLTAGLEDTDLYYRYATRALAGEVPYRDFPVEYPPLALPFFVAPRLVAAGVGGFKVAFAAEMLLCHAATVALVARRVERGEGPGALRRRLAWYTVVFLILSRLVVTRYDPAPALLGFAAAVWWSSGRGVAGGLAASLGAQAKGFPAVVGVVGAVHDLAGPGPWRDGRRVAGLSAFVLSGLLGAAAWLAVGGTGGVASALEYQFGRGFEYGSVISGAQMLAARIAGAEILVLRDRASFSTVTPWSGSLSRLVLPLQACALLVVCAVFVRRGAREGIRSSGAAVLGFILTGKVFSPQYLIWVVPYLAVLEGPTGPRARRLFAAVCAATLLAPALFRVAPRTGLWVIIAFDARNALALWLWALLVFGPEAGRRRPREDDR